VDESGPFEPFNPYGQTKLEAEGVYKAWAEEDPARSLVIIRPTVVFGEGNRGNVYNLLRQIASGRFMMVGPGTNKKSMAYVGNVTEFIIHALSIGPGTHLFNYVDGPDLDMNDLVKVVKRSLGKPNTNEFRIPKAVALAGGVLFDMTSRLLGLNSPISAIRVRKFCENTQFIASRIKDAGFSPSYSLSAALERTIRSEFGVNI
jgi:nucleoside-diphosphate-sugar epimerase